MLRGLFVIESRRAWVGSLPAAQGQPGSCGGPGAGVGRRCGSPSRLCGSSHDPPRRPWFLGCGTDDSRPSCRTCGPGGQGSRVRAWPWPPPVPPACSLGAAVLLGVRRPCEQTQLSGGARRLSSHLGAAGRGRRGGPVPGCPLRTFPRRSFLPLFIHSVIAYGAPTAGCRPGHLGPGGEDGLSPCPRGESGQLGPSRPPVCLPPRTSPIK